MPFSDKIVDNILELIDQAPMIRLNRIVRLSSAKILTKLESFNPTGSMKHKG